MSSGEAFLHYPLCCACGSTILLPYSTLVRAFDFPVPPARDKEPIAAVCNQCKRVQMYDLAKKSETPPHWGPMVLLPMNLEWVFLGGIECEEEAGAEPCTARLPLFAPQSTATSAEEWQAYVRSWTWNEMVCPKGHRIPPHKYLPPTE